MFFFLLVTLRRGVFNWQIISNLRCMIFLEFSKYKMEKSHLSDDYPAASGLLWIHLLAGRGLRAISTISPLAGIFGC